MTPLKITIDNRNYSNWSIFNATTLEPISVNIESNPIQHKLFSGDVFTINDNFKVDIVHSSVRSVDNIPAVLILSNNKTYGRTNKGKLLYKCVPDDVRLPTFLVPYEIKHVGFSKVYINLYISFTFSEWVDKHPTAIISKVIGPVNLLDNFYEYQLYCKSLNASIQKFQKATTSALENKSHDLFIESIQSKYPSIQDRTNNWYIFTIDPPNSLDLDDAFSIRPFEESGYQLTIYISNVTIWMDVLNVWEAFSRRISTIYLPDKKRPMLPTLLSDSLCSLQSDTTRIAFYMDIFINNGEIININYGNCFIKVAKNYSYEEPELLTLAIVICEPTGKGLGETASKLKVTFPAFGLALVTVIVIGLVLAEL